MCCHKNQDVIDECNKLFDENGEAIFYKVVTTRTYHDDQIIVESIYGKYDWKPGSNEAVIKSNKEYDVKGIRNPKGFHVCITKKDAMKLLHFYELFFSSIMVKKNFCMIEVVCKKEHLMKAGYSSIYGSDDKQAVFSQVIITQQEWDKHVEPNFSRENQS
ncbi:MAG: hypothetical protein QQN41_07315 [Nitrosopumilus sp.]